MENMKTRSLLLLKIKGLSLHLIDEVTGMSLADQPEGKVNQIFNVYWISFITLLKKIICYTQVKGAHMVEKSNKMDKSLSMLILTFTCTSNTWSGYPSAC